MEPKNAREVRKTLLKRFSSSKRADAYVIVIFLVALAFFAVIWYVFFSSDGWVTRVVNSTSTVHTVMGSDQNASYNTVTNFISVYMSGFLVITLIILMVAGLVYVQRRKAEDYLI